MARQYSVDVLYPRSISPELGAKVAARSITTKEQISTWDKAGPFASSASAFDLAAFRNRVKVTAEDVSLISKHNVERPEEADVTSGSKHMSQNGSGYTRRHDLGIFPSGSQRSASNSP